MTDYTQLILTNVPHSAIINSTENNNITFFKFNCGPINQPWNNGLTKMGVMIWQIKQFYACYQRLLSSDYWHNISRAVFEGQCRVQAAMPAWARDYRMWRQLSPLIPRYPPLLTERLIQRVYLRRLSRSLSWKIVIRRCTNCWLRSSRNHFASRLGFDNYHSAENRPDAGWRQYCDSRRTLQRLRGGIKWVSIVLVNHHAVDVYRRHLTEYLERLGKSAVVLNWH